MYNEYFGFQENPFDITPNPKFFFSSQNHREALASLILGVEEQKGIICLIGEVGTGKTLLLNSLAQEISNKSRIVNLIYPIVTFKELMIMVLAELGMSVLGRNKVQMIALLHEYLMRQSERGRTLTLVIDEAQNLDHTVLEEIRLLSNIETSTKKLLQIILSGQPELGVMLEEPSLRQIRQRIGVVCKLNPLASEEVEKYMEHRLMIAGYDGRKLFAGKAVQEICNFSCGIPRLINIICDNSLMISFAMEKKRVKRETVLEAIEDQSCKLYVEKRAAPPISQNQQAIPHHASGRFKYAASFLVVFLFFVLIFFYQFFPMDHNNKSTDSSSSSAPKVFTKAKEKPLLSPTEVPSGSQVPYSPSEEETPDSRHSAQSLIKEMDGSLQPGMARGRYLLRAGVYFNTYYLHQFAQVLEKHGYTPFTLTKKVQRDRYVLRLGPLENLSEFDQIQTSLKTENLKVEMISDKGNLYVVIGSSKEQDKLESIGAYWGEQGYDSIIENRSESKTMHLLMVGDYATFGEAKSAKQSLREHNIDSIILRNRISTENKTGELEASGHRESVSELSKGVT